MPGPGGPLARRFRPASTIAPTAAIKELRDSLASDDAAEITAKTDSLQAAFHKVSEQIYQAASEQAAADGAGSTNGGTAADEEEVVDAEVVDDGESK